MTAWIVSVIGLGLICAVVGIISHGMRLQKTIKTACAYIFILAFVLPLPTVLSQPDHALNCNYAFDTKYDQSVINVTNDAYFTTVAKSFDEYLLSRGYNTSTKIQGNVVDKIIIDNVLVTLFGTFADSSKAKLTVKDLTSEYFEISKEMVQVQFG